MTPRFYTREELNDLLEGNEISQEFRTAIKAALEEGTDAAIRSLGYFAMSARPTPEESLAFRQAGEEEYDRRTLSFRRRAGG